MMVALATKIIRNPYGGFHTWGHPQIYGLQMVNLMKIWIIWIYLGGIPIFGNLHFLWGIFQIQLGHMAATYCVWNAHPKNINWGNHSDRSRKEWWLNG